MSNNQKPSDKSKAKHKEDGPTTPYSPGMSMDDFQRVSEIFKSWADGSNLKWWVIAAGVGAIIESLHIGWLALRYIFKF